MAIALPFGRSHIVFTGHRDRVPLEEDLVEIARTFPGTTWVEGEGRGFDRAIRKFVKTHPAAKSNDINLEAVAANWELYGRAAGPHRNRRMLDRRPFLVIAGWDGRETGGTVDCMNEARRRGIRIHVIRTVKAAVAQTVERRTENAEVGGSIPSGRTGQEEAAWDVI